MNVGGYSATGPREVNEDSFFMADFSHCGSFLNGVACLAVVSDGMGGYHGGDVASGIAVAQSESYVNQLLEMAKGNQVDLDAAAALDEIVQHAHETICSQASTSGQSMGATFVGAFVGSERAWIGHVGDSRAYLVRDGKAVQLTEDHSQVGRMLARGLITEEEAQNHPDRNKIEQALGFSLDGTEIDETDIQPGDALLLCSDGVYTTLTAQQLAACIMREKDASSAAKRVVKAALAAGSDDNTTAVVVFPYRAATKGKQRTLSEADQFVAVTPATTTARHARSSKPKGRPRRQAGSGSARSPQGKGGVGGSTSGISASRIVPIVIGLLCVVGLAVLGLRACQGSQGAGVSGEQEATTGVTQAASTTSGVQGQVPDAGSNSSPDVSQSAGSSATTTQAGHPITLKSDTLVSYIDWRGYHVREFDAEDGLQSPNLILAQGTSVSTTDGSKVGDDGKQYVYLADSYTTDLIHDVKLYESGKRSFNSGFAQLFDEDSYLRTIEGIHLFFEMPQGYTIDEEVTQLVIPWSESDSARQTNGAASTQAE